jgi:Cdc6-like AAA superfamily ATPase
METPDILNSKIKKIMIELPQYSFSHSSSGDSSHEFIGRERISEKLKKVIVDSPDEPGVYMVTGDRGVGKTRLVNEIIKKTSWQPNSDKKDKKNRTRMYLRINFGHKLKEEKDILRLITSTLSTEYEKYLLSFRRMWFWWMCMFVYRSLLVLLVYLFSTIVAPVIPDDFCTTIMQNTFLWYCLFVVSSLFVYVLGVLLFRSTWITSFFVTHQAIMERLNKLNRDITHSTEQENSIHVKSNIYSYVSEVGTKTKQTRNVADAREIEKELQNILDDMRRIWRIICRPQIIIVFDELDKVEPNETGTEKESQHTKATLFSIGATRERQTEILRILSNMKYFLSTARAKFIFIAGREMYDIYLADVSERNNYIGSIFNVVFHVPSLLTDHPSSKEVLREESSIASLPEEFVCRRLLLRDCREKPYNLKSYREYLEEKITHKEEIQKIIAVLQQFIIYLAHVSKGAPKKMTQLFETFVTVRNTDEQDVKNSLVVPCDPSSRIFLSFSYYKQYTLGIIAYLMTPIFYRLSESNMKEHSDKLLVSTLRFVDFLFKFHKHSFTWKHLEISPEMMEPNRAPELKSVAIELLNYLAQVHINKSNFSLYDYKYDSWIANEIFTMTKTDDVFSALFSFSLDEMLPLKKHYQSLLEKAEKEYAEDRTSVRYIDSISSLQIVLGDLCYYDDELEEAGVYYKNAVEMLRKEDKRGGMSQGRLYLYVRNKLKIGMIHEKRMQYDFAYQTYGELCEQIIAGRNTARFDARLPYFKNPVSSNFYRMSIKKITYEGLKMLYLPFIAKLQILEKSHIGGITRNHLELLDRETEFLITDIDHEEANLLEAEFYSRIADVLYYKNADVKRLKRGTDNSENDNTENISCTACHYYYKALSVLLNKSAQDKPEKDSVLNLLRDSIARLNENFNVQYCTVLARILSDWGNVFFSCDSKEENDMCYICGASYCNTRRSNYCRACNICEESAVECNFEYGGMNDFETRCLSAILKKYVNYVKSEFPKEVKNDILTRFKTGKYFTKMEIAFAMYSISSRAYHHTNLFKRSAHQIYKMLCLLKHYKIYTLEYIKPLGDKAICFLWHANDDLGIFELNKRKKDFDKFGKDKDEAKIPLQNLLVNSEITKIRMLVRELELKADLKPETLRKYYGFYITSPYKINYSVGGRIYSLRLKSIVNYEAYRQLLGSVGICEIGRDFVLNEECYRKLEENKYGNVAANKIFGRYFGDKEDNVDVITVLENLIAETIYCLVDIVQLAETMGETYVFTNSFFGTIHEHLSFWIRQYEEYERYENGGSNIGKLLEKYLDEEWRELLSAHRENRQALSHYHKCLEMHNEGRAYHTMIDTMCYVKDDYNDHSDHFNIAEERHYMLNAGFKKKFGGLGVIYKDSELYNVDNYFDGIQDYCPNKSIPVPANSCSNKGGCSVIVPRKGIGY